MSTRSIFTLAGSGLAIGICTATALAGGPLTYSNPAPITIPALGTASPYGSTIQVSKLVGNITDLNVTLTGFNHTFPDDIGILLVGPTGAATWLADGPGDGTDAVSLNLTFDDAAAAELPAVPPPPLSSGSWKPMNQYNDVLNPPAPAGPHPKLMSTFNGTSPNGTWTLYVQDFVGGDSGSISGGFTISMTGPQEPNNECLEPLEGDCLGDFNNDGNRDVNDLLTLIGVFGQTGPPRPVADIAPLPNGDCTVDVNDLLPLVGGWGACPATDGACCMPSGTCVADQTPEDCAKDGGAFQGLGVACGEVACPILFDDCAGALAIGLGDNVVDNSAATPAVASTIGTCGTSTVRDIWLKYTAPRAGFISLDTCDPLGPQMNTSMVVYSGTCAGLTQVVCDTTTCAGTLAQGGFNAAVVDVPMAAGQTLYFRIGTQTNSAPVGLAGPLNARVAFKDNDFCIAAETLAFGTAVQGSLADATGDNVSCEGNQPGAGRWYKFTGNGNIVNVSTCATDPEDNIYFQAVTVLCAVSCTETRCANGGDYDDVCSPFESFSLCTRAGKTYFIVVLTTDLFGTEGNYELVVTNTGTSCPSSTAALCPLPLTNDTCATAKVITPPAPGGTLIEEFDNTSATIDQPSPTCIQPSPFGKTVWYKLTPTANGTWDFVLGDAGGGSFDSTMAIYSSPGAGSCANLTQVACDDDGVAGAGFSQILNLNLTTANTYYIVVGTWNDTAGGVAQLSIHRD